MWWVGTVVENEAGKRGTRGESSRKRVSSFCSCFHHLSALQPYQPLYCLSNSLTGHKYKMPHSWKTGQRPSAAYGPGTLAIGLRIVYTGKKAKKFPRASHQPHLLDVNQRAVLLDDLAHLGRKIGGANPRKDDTQVSGFMAGCVEVVWPDLRKYTARYEVHLELNDLDCPMLIYISCRVS